MLARIPNEITNTAAASTATPSRYPYKESSSERSLASPAHPSTDAQKPPIENASLSRISSMMTGNSIIAIIIIPTAPILLRKSSTDAASVPRVDETLPPDTGIKLLTANLALRIVMLSAFDARKL